MLRSFEHPAIALSAIFWTVERGGLKFRSRHDYVRSISQAEMKVYV